MPVYEYECEKCSHRFELKRSFRDGSATECPKCGSSTRRIFSAVPVIFKGAGFYVTDNRAKNPAGSTRGGDGQRPVETGAGKESTGNGDKGEVAPSSANKLSEKQASNKDKNQ